MRDLFDEFFEKYTTSLNKFWVIAVLHLHVANVDRVGHFFWNRWNVASWPAVQERFVKCLKLIKSSLRGEITLLITASDSIFSDFAYLCGISDRERQSSLRSFIFLLLSSLLNLLDFLIKS